MKVAVILDEPGPLTVERAVLANFDVLAIPRHEVPRMWSVIKNVDGLILGAGARANAAFIRNLERCRVICCCSVGIDQVDLQAATTARIVVTHIPDYCIEEVAEHTIALMLGLCRQLVNFDRVVRTGKWAQGTDAVRRVRQGVKKVSGTTLGLVGCGRIGQAVAKRAVALGQRLIAFDPYVCPTSLPGYIQLTKTIIELLAQSDFVSLHVPLTLRTRGLIGRREFRYLKPGAVLINTSRGNVLDYKALLDALREGRLAGAGIDVFPNEPLPPNDPILGLENVILTPHSAAYSQQAFATLRQTAAEEIRLVLAEGKPPRYALNPTVLER